MADKPTFTRGAALDELQRRYGGLFAERETAVTIGTSSGIAVAPSSERVSLTFINLGASDVVISTKSPATLTRGILIPSGGGIVAMSVQEDGHLPTVGWFGISAVANTGFIVLEAYRDISAQ